MNNLCNNRLSIRWCVRLLILFCFVSEFPEALQIRHGLAQETATKNDKNNDDAPSGEKKLRHNDSLISFSFSPDGSHIVSVSLDDSLSVWNVVTGELEARHTPKNFVRSPFTTTPRFFCDSTAVAWGSSEGVWMWKWKSEKMPKKLASAQRAVIGSEWYPFAISDLANSERTQKWLAYSDCVGEIKLLDWTRLSVRQIQKASKLEYAGPEAINYLLCWSPKQDYLAYVTDDSIRVLDVASGVEINKLRGPKRKLLSIGFSQDSKQVIAVEDHRFIHVWDRKSGTHRKLESSHEGVAAATISATGNLVAIGRANGEIHLWSIMKSERVASFQGQKTGIVCLAFSPDERFLVSAGEENLLLFLPLQK